MNYGFNCFSPRVLTNKAGKKVFASCGRCPACIAKRRAQVVSLMRDYNEVFPYCEFITLTYSNENLPYFDNGKVSFPALSRKDAQDFLKRLRKNIVNHGSKTDVPPEKGRIAYFLCGEYGPKTHRPHMHALVFHQSQKLCRDFKGILLKSWKLGFLDFSHSGNNGCIDYVAKYVAKSDKVFKNFDLLDEERRELAPFLFHSAGLYSKEISRFKSEFEEIIRNGTLTRVRQVDNGYRLQPLSSSVQNFLFPKCREFDNLSRAELVRSYTFSREYRSFEECSEKNSVECFESFADAKTYYNRLKSDYYKSRRFLQNCLLFNIDEYKYIDLIQSYYKGLDYNNLKTFYQILEQVIEEYPGTDLNLYYVDKYKYSSLKQQKVFDCFKSDSVSIERKRSRTKVLNDIHYNSNIYEQERIV